MSSLCQVPESATTKSLGKKLIKMAVYSVADPGFLRGCANPIGGPPIYCLAIKEIGP